MNKSNKAIKRLQKQLENMNARVETLSEQVRNLQGTPDDDTVTDPKVEKSKVEFIASAPPNITEEEFEKAMFNASEEDEIVSIKHKKAQIGAKKKKNKKSKKKG